VDGRRLAGEAIRSKRPKGPVFLLKKRRPGKGKSEKSSLGEGKEKLH